MSSAFQTQLPKAGAPCESLGLTNSLLTTLPSLGVTGTLRLRGMKRLTSMAGGDWHTLSLCGCPKLTSLPPLTRPLKKLELDGCGIERLPEDLSFGEDAELIIQNCPWLTELPPVVSEGRLHSIIIRNCPRLRELPALSVRGRIELDRMPVRELHAPLAAKGVLIGRCAELRVIRSRMEAESAGFGGCAELEEFAAPATVLHTLSLKGCRSLRALPEGLKFAGGPARLDLTGCAALTSLPAGLTAMLVNVGVERHQPVPALTVQVEGCPLRHAPDYPFTWRVQIRGVQMEPRALLDPQGIDPSTLLRHPNAEVRRVLLENLGMENLLARADYAIMDEDTDAGGRRRLFQFRLPPRPPRRIRRPAEPMLPTVSERAGYRAGNFLMRLMAKCLRRPPKPGPPALESPPAPAPPPPTRGLETLQCRHLECRCPSTGRLYLLPVPPHLASCHAAAAWLAGFNDPNDYAPVLET